MAMAPVSRFRKPDWQHRDPERRAAAVASAKEKELLEELPRLAREDDAPEVRLAALKRLDDWVLLADLAAGERDDTVANAAWERALDLLTRDDSADADRARSLLKAAGDKGRLRLLREARSPRLRRALLDSTIDPVVIAERALKEENRELREAALVLLDDTEQIERVVKGARNRDKRLWRMAAEKLEERLVTAGDPEACGRAAARVVEALEGMARSADTDTQRRAALEAEWQALPRSAREPFLKRFEGASRILARAAEPRPEPAAPEPPADAPAPDADRPPPPEIPPALAEIAHEAELLAEQEQPSVDAAAQLEKRWRRHWKASMEAHPEAAALRRRLEAALDRARQKRDRADQARHQHRETVDRYIEALERHLEAGDLHEAREADHQLKIYLRESGPRPNRAQDRRLAAAHRKLGELRDWQHWANNRVRQRLCEEVEGLPESDLHPDAMLEALKRAQKEWRELEESEKLSGETRAYRASGPGLWKRFQAAGKKAFDHAKPFLEKRTELRHQKLEAVRELLTELEGYREAEDVGDPRALARRLSSARRALSRLGELPPPERGPTARALRQLLDDLGGRLAEAREGLAREKEALIREAESLDPEADLPKAIGGAKSIMARWKKLDTLPRGRERRYWQELRTQLDPIFDKRDAGQAEEREQRALEQRDLESLCQEAEKLSDLTGEALERATPDINRLRGQWQQHARRPKALEKRFREALDAFRHRLAEQREARRFEHVRSLFERARICRRLEGGDLGPDDAKAAWRDLPALPEALEKRTGARLETAANPAGADTLEENLAIAGRAVLTMELVAGVDSPPDARSARMELKVSRLNESMRGEREAKDPEEEMDALLSEWAATGPLATEAAKPLEERAAQALEAFYGQKLD